jgi:hypothetical protein
MELLRVPPYPKTVEISVSESMTQYEYSIEDLADHSIIFGDTISDSNSKVYIELSSEYDSSFLITVDETETFIDFVRPYVDPYTKMTTASEITEYAKHEELARAIIDSIVREGFYYKKRIVETTGLGLDYLPIWADAKKVLKVIENNLVVWDSSNPEAYSIEYRLSDNKTAVTQGYSDILNRYESSPLLLRGATSDYENMRYTYRGFPKTWDYTIVIATGHRSVPSDIVRATELLIEDISCGKLDYYKRYISQYNTDQFRLQFDKQVFEGTGNILVDKILSKYTKSIRSIGVL